MTDEQTEADAELLGLCDALLADMKRLREVYAATAKIVAAAVAFNAHFMHVSTGAAGTTKRRDWERECERLGERLNDAIAACRAVTEPKL
jgi:hypothetical protein